MDRKFIERFDVSDWEVLTPDGYVDIVATHKTIEYDRWEIEFDDGQVLAGADNHIIIDKNGREVYIKDSLFSEIKSESGLKTVVDINNTEIKENMYDLELALDSNCLYYTSGILSHNTTLTAVYLLWKVLFTDDYSIAILANKAETAREILGRIQLSYEELPYWLQQGVVEWNKGSIVLENRSKIFTGATTASGIRGKSVNCLYVDETAFVPTKIAEEFFTSIFPTLSSSRTTQLILSSTPNGYNHFYDFWQGSINGTNDFVRFSITWDQVPGRDQEWYDEQLRLLGRIKFNQEVLCSFLGSSDTLIKPEALERHYEQAKSVTPIYESNEDEPYFTQFKKPKKNHVYFITVDTSKGGGGDYQVATVFDISKYPYEVVEVFRSNEIGDTEVPEIYYDLATKWNDAYLLVETNKSDKIAYSLWAEFEYENLLSVVKDGDGRWQLRHVDVSELGINTNKKIKKDGCSMARKLAEEDGIIVNSLVLAKEMRTFVYKNGSFEAEETYNDDVMMTFVLFAWCTSQDFFKDVSLKMKDEVDRIMESEEEEFVHRNVIFINDNTPTGIRQVDYGENMQLTPEEEFFFGHLIKRRR